MSKKRIYKEIELLVDKYNNVTVEKINEKSYFIKVKDIILNIVCKLIIIIHFNHQNFISKI